jgi:hypothetical protein
MQGSKATILQSGELCSSLGRVVKQRNKVKRPASPRRMETNPGSLLSNADTRSTVLRNRDKKEAARRRTIAKRTLPKKIQSDSFIFCF